MRFELTVLGCSSALPTISKYPTAHVLNIREQFYLIDCGEGVQKQLKKFDINILKINHIFISHLHGDHVYGIFGLISSMGLLGRERALEIFAPSPIKEIVENHLNFFDKWLPYKIICHVLDSKQCGVILETNSITVETIPLKHSVETVGFVFREKEPKRNVLKSAIEKHNLMLSEIIALKNGEDISRDSGDVVLSDEVTYLPYIARSFAYCCDTSYAERYIDKIKGIDMLMHEATYLKEDQKSAKKRFHSTTHDAAKAAVKAGVKQLVITHFSTRYRTHTSKFLEEAKEIFENTLLAKEGVVFSIPLKHSKLL